MKSVYISQPASDDILATVQEIEPGVLPAFETGFLQTQRIRFNYKDRKDNRTERLADPHGMLVLSPVWYLIGFDPDKSAFRHFRMDRISQAEVLNESFKRQPFALEGGECPFTFSSG